MKLLLWTCSNFLTVHLNTYARLGREISSPTKIFLPAATADAIWFKPCSVSRSIFFLMKHFSLFFCFVFLQLDWLGRERRYSDIWRRIQLCQWAELWEATETTPSAQINNSSSSGQFVWSFSSSICCRREKCHNYLWQCEFVLFDVTFSQFGVWCCCFLLSGWRHEFRPGTGGCSGSAVRSGNAVRCSERSADHR